MSYRVRRCCLALFVLTASAGCAGQPAGERAVEPSAPAKAVAILALTSAPPDLVPPTPLSSVQAGQRDIGVLNRHDGPFPSSLFGVVNEYSGPFGDGWLMIYAGGARDPNQTSDPFVGGAIRIEIGLVDPSVGTPGPIEQFDVPRAPTWVKIVAVSGGTVTLQRQDGSEVRFDLMSHAFAG